jgi:hypothetical protein
LKEEMCLTYINRVKTQCLGGLEPEKAFCEAKRHEPQMRRVNRTSQRLGLASPLGRTNFERRNVFDIYKQDKTTIPGEDLNPRKTEQTVNGARPGV